MMDFERVFQNNASGGERDEHVVGYCALNTVHTLKNLVYAVQGYSELLEIKYGDTIAEVSGLNSVVSEMNEVLRGMHSYAQGHALDTCEKTSIPDLLNDVHLIARAMTPTTVDLVFACPVDIPPVYVYASLLKQALLNLISNAAQAILHDDGRVRCEAQCSPDGENVLITIADNGVGMTQELVNQVGEVRCTTKSDDMGFGIGLNFVKTVAELHGGNFSIDSVPGNGTEIRLSLPNSTEKSL